MVQLKGNNTFEQTLRVLISLCSFPLGTPSLTVINTTGKRKEPEEPTGKIGAQENMFELISEVNIFVSSAIMPSVELDLLDNELCIKKLTFMYFRYISYTFYRQSHVGLPCYDLSIKSSTINCNIAVCTFSLRYFTLRQTVHCWSWKRTGRKTENYETSGREK